MGARALVAILRCSCRVAIATATGPLTCATFHETNANRDAQPQKSTHKKANMSEAHSNCYEPPCKLILRSRVVCEACSKEISLHTLKYRHRCFPMVDRLKRAKAEAQQAAKKRAQSTLEEEKANKYAHLFMR